ncbi:MULTISPECIES: ATP-binding protein [unclassified Kitasatospora]|uniref:ATP-binding protein n=1 Tax=unclassified Kitasatospora TaxID=2633591 RepID=UPI0009E94953
MALMMAHEVPTSSTMAVPHGPAGVGAARRRLRRDLGDHEVAETVIDDAVLILSELLSNSCRYARPLGRLADLKDDAPAPLPAPVLVGVRSGEDGEPGGVTVRWQLSGHGQLTLEVTDGGAVTRPVPARPSLSSRGGRGLTIVGRLADDWGVRDAPGQVTVWAELPVEPERDARSA